MTPDNIKPFFQKAMDEYDFIVVDAGKSFTETLITVFGFFEPYPLVATPDILAVYQIKWCLDVLQSLQFPLKMVKLILNRSESHGSVAWQEVRSALPCEIFSHIPSDGKVVGLALNRGSLALWITRAARLLKLYENGQRSYQKRVCMSPRRSCQDKDH